MALVPVEIVNNSGQTVGMTLEEPGEQLDYFRKQVRADALHSVKVLRTSPTRKPAAAPAK